MMCGCMISVSGRMVPCGQCMPCRINHKRMWAGRLMLEQAHCSTTSSFLTLTYETEPEGRNLSFSDANGFLDRLRHRSGIGAVRYFIVGEYGDKTQRPHYHAAIFNVPPEDYEKVFQDTWGLGHVHTGILERASANYLTGYCTKKLTRKDDSRLDGRVPEFARMSRRPPLGAAGMNHIRSLLQTRAGCTALAKYQDVPNSFRIMGKEYPMGRYWLNWMRNEMGITNPPVNSEWRLDYEEFTAKQEQAQKVAVKLWARKDKKVRRL